MAAVGTIEAAPGERAAGRIDVGEGRDGSPVSLPVCVIEGAADGRTLYIQAASDGDELNGVGVVNQLVPRLDPETLSGTVIVVGIANIYGFLQGSHRNPIDDTKLNRVYPGDLEGSTSERIAARTFEIARDADLALDLHQGSTSRMLDEVRIRCGRHHDLHDDCLELASVFGAGHILDQKGPDGQLARVAADEGIPIVDPELGGAVGWDQASIERGVAGVENLLGYYGFIDRDVEVEPQVRAAGFDRYAAPRGGLVRYDVALGDGVSAGDQLFRVTDVFGAEQGTVTADADGVFWRSRRLPQVATGEYVCSVGTQIDEV
jgi:predicted deacylase